MFLTMSVNEYLSFFFYPRFIASGLIDETIMRIISILIGEGTPLFGTLVKDVKLRHIAT